MLDSNEIDEKLNALREINECMKKYSHKTPIKQVSRDYSIATNLYNEIAETILELQGERD